MGTRSIRTGAYRLCMATLVGILVPGHAFAQSTRPDAALTYRGDSGIVTVHLDQSALDRLGWSVVFKGRVEPDARDLDPTFMIDSAQALAVTATDGDPVVTLSGKLTARGALLLSGNGRRIVISPLSIGFDGAGQWRLAGAASGLDSADAWPLELSSCSAVLAPSSASSGSRRLSLTAELAIAPDAGLPEPPSDAPWILGRLSAEVWLVPAAASDLQEIPAQDGADYVASTAMAGGIGPDVVVEGVASVRRYGRVGDITSYSMRTTACNIGDVWANWIGATTDHPVISQHIYRLKDGAIEQIGLSWVKHGFFALGDECAGGSVCDGDPEGQHLGVGCSDPYSSGLNGIQGNLTPRYEVNATTGEIVWPPATFGETGNAIYKRVQVHDADVDPALNAGALYFIEAQYVLADDAAAGNQDNNASYAEVEVSEPQPSVFKFIRPGPTQVGNPAILAWEDNDPNVNTIFVDVPGDRRFILSYKVSEVDAGWWHYEYAVHNLNSDRSARSFSVPMRGAIGLANVGFHDIDSHSGSPLDSTDWDVTQSDCAMTWATESYDVNPDANALRWGTLYNFRFDADVPPVPGNITLGLFKPGTPEGVTVPAAVPQLPATSLVLVGSEPIDGAIDARQPSNPDGSDVTGWQSIDLMFNACANALDLDDLSVTQQGGAAPAPVVGSWYAHDQVASLWFDRPVALGAWTTVTHAPSGVSRRVGYLPGDVDGNGISEALDITALIDAINGIGPPRLSHSTDVDRSHVTGPPDILRVIDLLNGAGVYDVYLNMELP